MRTAEIAKRFLRYFEGREHLVVPSASLISPNPTTLFTIAGMVPFIPYLLGEQTPPRTRMASQQKCVRTLDIDEVGKTTRHGTFFQMMGNFSFGDYFKEEAIHYAWHLLTTPQDQGGYGFDPAVLWVTVFEDDDEARALWINEGVDPEHIQKLGMEDNFWTTGGPGPGGPCSEIYVDRGSAYGREGGPAVDDNRYIEIWDLVFENYEVDNVKSKTNLHIVGELEHKNIDTGMGLERVAYLLQGRQNIYEIDEIFPVIAAAEKLSGRRYGDNEADDVRFRIVADHVRSALMIMSDGVRPSNLGRGYVLRRLLRRTIRSMKMLGVDSEVLPFLLPASKNIMKNSYPELETTFADVQEAAYGEEDAFRRTLSKGIEILDLAVSNAKNAVAEANGSTPKVSGADAFQLHDTYGFPIELTLEIANEQGVSVDEDEFKRLMAEQKNRARQDALKKRHNVDVSVYDAAKKKLIKPQEFLGYTDYTARGTVLGILTPEGAVDSISAPASIELILDKTPFYAEKGGQQADHGEILSDSGAVLEVDDVQNAIKGLTVHQCRLTDGVLRVGDQVTSNIDVERRLALGRSHTATHILHQTLRDVLGSQATQRGSVVAPDFLHFDYQASKAPSKENLAEIERRVNERIREDLPVTMEEMPLDDALKLGAMHLFGDKYGDIVRVVTIGKDAWSRELCGGTHLDTTGQVGQFVITAEMSNGSGVRRIDAYCGKKAYEFNASEHALVNAVCAQTNSRPDELQERIASLIEQLKADERRLASIQARQLHSLVPAIVEAARQRMDVAPVVVASANVGSFGDVDAVRSVVTDVRSQLGEDKPVVVVLAGIGSSGRPLIFVATNKAARSVGIKAGNLVHIASTVLGGGGGGRPDFAQGGGTDSSKVDEALSTVAAVVSDTRV